jgi:hypothetical protein
MMGDWVRPRLDELRRVLEPALRVEFGEIDVRAACLRFEAAGYTVTPWLCRFLENYSELTVVWRASRGGENELVTSVEAALDAPRRNVLIDAERLGREVVPVGVAFETEEWMLLTEDGDIILSGDAGMQRVGNGFEESLRALLANDWDKAFF